MAADTQEVLLFNCITAKQVFGVSGDTTASNTGINLGANVILEKQLLWFMCRCHSMEVHISHLMTSLTGQATKSQQRDFYEKNNEVPKIS